MRAAAAVRGVARDLGMDDLRVGVVSGDDITTRLDDLRAGGTTLAHLDTGASMDSVRDRVVFAVAYLGAQPIVDALQRESDVIVTGRVADASLFVAPMVHELAWAWDDWDKLAAGVVLRTGSAVVSAQRAPPKAFASRQSNTQLITSHLSPITSSLSPPAGIARIAISIFVRQRPAFSVLTVRLEHARNVADSAEPSQSI